MLFEKLNWKTLLLGAHASLRAGREAFKKTRREFNLILGKGLYAAKRDVARTEACAPSNNDSSFQLPI